MTERSNPIVAMFASADVLIDPNRKDWLASCIQEVASHDKLSDLMADTTASAGDDGFWPAADDWRAAYRPYVVKNGVLQIPVKGILLHDFPWALGSWATGYDYIQRAFERGCRDYEAGNIKGIALLVNSGGGLVAGCFDALDRNLAAKARSGVPVRAFAHEHMYSAAYATSMVADRIDVSRTGGVGSIGTLRTHIDWSKFNERFGLTYTFIQAGKFKTDGHPDKPLSDEAAARWQAQVEEVNDIFIAAVSRGRGLDEQAVRDFEAATFSASQALSNGLADSIGTLDDALAAFVADLSSTQGDDQMSTQDKAADTQAANNEAAQAAAVTAARNEGVTAGQKAERERITAIIGSDAAKDRPVAALSAALETDMSADQATAFLAKLPVEKTEAAAPSGGAPDAFTERMNATPTPDVGAGGGGEGGDEVKNTVDQILADQSAVTGAERKRG